MRLHVTVQRPEYAVLLDERVAPAKRERAKPYALISDEVWTPGGFPLRFKVMLGLREDLEIRTADTVLFQTFSAHDYFTMTLWVPTDETIEVALCP
jgi:hypothetical protein